MKKKIGNMALIVLLGAVILTGCSRKEDFRDNEEIEQSSVETENAGKNDDSTETTDHAGENGNSTEKTHHAGAENGNSTEKDTSLQDAELDRISDLWEQKAAGSDGNVIEFVTGLQIIFPKEWKGKVVTYTEPAMQTYGGGLEVCEKLNDEANAGGGMLFTLEYLKYDESAIGPYQIFNADKVLGVYQNGEDRYALILTKPRDMQYVEGNQEMQKIYEETSALTNQVQVITDHMEGFTECGLYDLDWIVLSGYEQPGEVEMTSYGSPNFELEYPAAWEVKEQRGEDGSRISFLDETGEAVFWIETGEAWRVDLNSSIEDCERLLAESYQDVAVVDLSKIKVDGCDAQKLIFSFISDGVLKAITRYTVVDESIFYEMNYADFLDMMSGSNLGETVVDSVRFN